MSGGRALVDQAQSAVPFGAEEESTCAIDPRHHREDIRPTEVERLACPDQLVGKARFGHERAPHRLVDYDYQVLSLLVGMSLVDIGPD